MNIEWHRPDRRRRTTGVVNSHGHSGSPPYDLWMPPASYHGGTVTRDEYYKEHDAARK